MLNSNLKAAHRLANRVLIVAGIVAVRPVQPVPDKPQTLSPETTAGSEDSHL